MTMPKKGLPRKYLSGVYQSQGSTKYKAKICRNGEAIYLGAYDTEQEAHEAYLEYKKSFPADYSDAHKAFEHAATRSLNLDRKINADLIRTVWQGL